MSGMATSSTSIPMGLDEALIVQALSDADATRYLGAVGVSILLYDHLLTLHDEAKLVWKAPPSFAKFAFLLNRYLVFCFQLAVAHEMCGFVGNVYSNDGCRNFLFTTSLLSLFSVGIGNVLVITRVIMLWDRRPFIVKLLSAGFVISISSQVAMMILTLIRLGPGMQWNPIARMCITTTTTPSLTAVWGTPMFFEVLVLGLTFLNALDRPQLAEVPLMRALYRDGLTYFFTVTCFRVLNLTLSATARSTLTMVGVFFVWAMTTTILNRALLRIRKTQLEYERQVELARNRHNSTAPLAGRGGPDEDVIVTARWIELQVRSP